MLSESLADFAAWSQGLDVLRLHLLNDCHEMCIQHLHDREERAVS